MEHTCNGEYKLIHVNTEDRAFYRNMLLFMFTGQLLECARSKGINPDIEGDPGYFGFHQDDIDRYGYYFLFLRNLPHYTEKIWYLGNADYFHLMPIKEKCKKEKELAAEAEEEEMKKRLLKHQGLLVMRAYMMNGRMSRNIHMTCAALGS
jgi:hypothetical protein